MPPPQTLVVRPLCNDLHFLYKILMFKLYCLRSCDFKLEYIIKQFKNGDTILMYPSSQIKKSNCIFPAL